MARTLLLCSFMPHSKSLSSKIAKHLVLAGVTLGCVSVPLSARADDDRSGRRDRGGGQTHIALDFDFGSAIDTPQTSSGGGGALRLGQQFDLFLVSLRPEIGGGYHAFGGDGETKIYSGFLGGRLGFGKIIEPSIFAHLGVARVTGFETRTAPVLDAGVALDFTLLPLIDLGVHGAYNTMFPRNDGSALEFVTFGAHAALVL